MYRNKLSVINEDLIKIKDEESKAKWKFNSREKSNGFTIKVSKSNPSSLRNSFNEKIKPSIDSNTTSAPTHRLKKLLKVNSLQSHNKFRLSQSKNSQVSQAMNVLDLNKTPYNAASVPHFMSAMMYDRPDEMNTHVKEFLNGVPRENSLDNINQMQFSVQTLYESAKEISKKLSLVDSSGQNTEQLEYENLRTKFSNDIRNKPRYLTHQRQNIIFESNFGEVKERMIDQINNHNQKKSIGRDQQVDIFVPKQQYEDLMNKIVKEAEKDMKTQQEKARKEEAYQVERFVSDMRRYKEGIQDMLYQLNHLQRIKKVTNFSGKSVANPRQNILKYLLSSTKDPKAIQRTSDEISEFNEHMEAKHEELFNEEYKADLRFRMRKAFQIFFGKLKRLRLSLDDIINKQAFPTAPFQHQGSYTFMKLVKERDIEEVEKKLKGYKYFVYDFDNNMKTALHFAAGYNDVDLIKLLMDYGADQDARDMIGRTALHYAVKHGFEEATRVLLIYGADPSVKTIAGRQPIEMTKINVLQGLLRNAKKFHFMMDLIPKPDRRAFWLNKAVPFFKEQEHEKIIKLQLYKSQAN